MVVERKFNTYQKSTTFKLINNESPDFVCLQETKTLNEQFHI